MEGVGAIERAEEKLGASVARHGDNSECFAYLPAWASTDDGREVEGVMKRIKADMICELVGVRQLFPPSSLPAPFVFNSIYPSNV